MTQAATHAPGPTLVEAWVESRTRPEQEMAMRGHVREVLEQRADLLDALKDYDNAFTDLDPDDRASRHTMRLAIIKGRAAIAKAEGR
jgi:hypothetical protein